MKSEEMVDPAILKAAMIEHLTEINRAAMAERARWVRAIYARPLDEVLMTTASTYVRTHLDLMAMRAELRARAARRPT